MEKLNETTQNITINIPSGVGGGRIGQLR
jgi:hypothetical protein